MTAEILIAGYPKIDFAPADVLSEVSQAECPRCHYDAERKRSYVPRIWFK